jgi:hypothetical protein
MHHQHPQVGRKRNVLDLERSAIEEDRMVRATVDGGHLVLDAARHAGCNVLCLLRRQRKVMAAYRDTRCVTQRERAGDFECGA